MENVEVSRRNHTNKGNKENAQPTHGSKSLIKRDKTSVAPLHLKSNEKEASMAKNGPVKVGPKQADTKTTTGVALKKVKTVQRNDVAQRQTHSKVFLTEQAEKHKKIAADAPKLPSKVPSSRSAPGTYKGKLVQSKIGSIWKSSASVDQADPKQLAPKMDSQAVGRVTETMSKSVVGLSGRGTTKPKPTVSKVACERPAQLSKPSVTRRQPAGFNSARPPARTIPATLTRNPTVAATKGSGTLNSKPKAPVTNRKINKPPVSSTLSQYRLTMDTAEEKKAKLAEWLASKGKTFKRPAMATAAPPPKTKVSQPGADLKSQSRAEPRPSARYQPETEPRVEACELDSPAGDCADTQGAVSTMSNQTTLQLLENSDDDLQDSVGDVVVNLCDALEAMATPSRCSDEVSHECDGIKMEDGKPKDPGPKEEGKNVAKESDEYNVETDEDDLGSEDVIQTLQEMEDASVVKYSVKTTPYLQSVKKTIEVEASSSTSRRKSKIKDLKFLTPVRRSTRIQRKSSHLPMMLMDHDPCVSSLAELVKLDDDTNAYIYRKNPALLEDLPDHPES